ncbi:MAG: ImmA/IrrE family metallo-endopeptidase [Bacteroidetes bacterium]|nr:ImmA/IrrE family metallo-endopeptidase [Bacteroidota bacterium]
MSQRVDVNPELLSWAVTRAGFTLPEFAADFPMILDWMSGKKPTLIQLEKFSKKVHVPFGYLMLPAPPEEQLPIPFFRTGKGTTEKVSVNVYDTILQLQQRQDWLRDYFKDNEFEPVGFVGKFRSSRNYAEIAQDIRTTLGLPEEWASGFRTWEEALTRLTEKIEDQRIVVVFNGVVGNNTTRPISVEECRGFVLVDDLAPFMFINNSDSKSAQLFTLVHELAHIWVGQSAGFDFRRLQPADNATEILCDKVAAEFLVPAAHFLKIWSPEGGLRAAARHFKVSEIVVARRALDLGVFTKKQFFDFYEEYIGREFKKRESGGGDFFRTTKVRLSLSFAAHVNRAVRSGQLLYRDAYKLTNLTGATYQTFVSKYF